MKSIVIILLKDRCFEDFSKWIFSCSFFNSFLSFLDKSVYSFINIDFISTLPVLQGDKNIVIRYYKKEQFEYESNADRKSDDRSKYY